MHFVVLGSDVNVIPGTEIFILLQAYQHLGEVTVPKFTVIVGQKNHHTKFFQAGAPENVPPGLLLLLVFNLFIKIHLIPVVLILSLSVGTVVDTKVVHPKNYDFYMCAHAGMIVSSFSNV